MTDNIRALLEQVEPDAWRTFDGEGGYIFSAYEDNEDYQEWWEKRNPHHKGWVEPLYLHPPTPAWHDEPVLGEVAKERQRQDAKWGGPEHDDLHSFADWHRFINLRLARSASTDEKETRMLLIQIAALAVAAVESIDRAAIAKAEGGGFRRCEFCGCNTNAKMRACCDAGRDKDKEGGAA